MKKRRVYAIGLTVVLLIVVTILVTFYHNANLHQQNSGQSTGSFFLEPVVDLIVPGLFSNGINAPLNLTMGATSSLIVEIFPLTINLRASVNATITSLSVPNENLSDNISTNFEPSQLSINQGSSANTTLSIRVSETAQPGAYSVTVTATNLENESQYWGTIFQLNVLR